MRAPRVPHLPNSNNKSAVSVVARPREALLRYGIASAVALALHLGLAALFLLRWPSQAPVSESAALIVNLAPLSTSPAPTFTLTPPGPQKMQAEQPQKLVKHLKTPKFKSPPVMKGEVQLYEQDPAKQKVQPSPDIRPSPQSTDMPSTLAATKDQVAAAPASASGASTTTPRTAEERWEDAVLAKLERAKRYPGLAQMRALQDIVYLRFTTDRQGHVLSARIDRSHGIAMLDDEVLSLIHRVGPLPPLPSQITGETIELVVPVEFFLKQHN